MGKSLSVCNWYLASLCASKCDGRSAGRLLRQSDCLQISLLYVWDFLRFRGYFGGLTLAMHVCSVEWLKSG